MFKNQYKIMLISIAIFFLFIMSFTFNRNHLVNKQGSEEKTGCIAGLIFDKDGGETEPLPKTNVLAFKQMDTDYWKYHKSENIVAGCASDSTGHYVFSDLEPGLYIIVANALVYHPSLIANVDVAYDSVTILNIGMTYQTIPEGPLPKDYKGIKMKKVKRDSTNCP